MAKGKRVRVKEMTEGTWKMVMAGGNWLGIEQLFCFFFSLEGFLV